MAILYVDTDGSGASTPFATWATAAQTFEAAIEDAACVAGSTIFMQGAAADEYTATTVFTSAGTAILPITVIGCINGTSAEPPLTADMSSQAGADMPVISTITTAGIDLSITGSVSWHGMEFGPFQDRVDCNGTSANHTFTDCLIANTAGGFRASAAPLSVVYNKCTVNFNYLWGTTLVPVVYNGCTITTTNANYVIRAGSVNGAMTTLYGCDLSGCTATALVEGHANTLAQTKMINCKLKTSWTGWATAVPTNGEAYLELIGSSSNTGAKADGSSYPDYYKEDGFGVVENEATVVRTNGADDGASGAFAYKMTLAANAGWLTGNSTLKSPMLSVWVDADGSAKTATVYIANSTASTDYNEDEVRCDFFTPNDGDTADHVVTFDPISEIWALPSSTAITDDTGSTWGTGGNNHQKFSVTVTPGYTGWMYARVHLGKSQATPDTLYVDPKIEIT